MRSPVLPPVILAALTILFIWPLFKIGYTSNLGSLEPAVLIMAKRVAEDGIWGWYPNWYLGFPFRFAGPPLTWWVLGALNKLVHLDILTGYRILIFSSLLIFPVSFYFLARRVFDSVSAGPVAGSSHPTSSAEKHSTIDLGNFSIKSICSRVLRALDGTPSACATHINIASFVSTIALLFLPSVGYIFPKYFEIGQNFGFAPSWILGASPARSMALALLPMVLLVFWNLIEKISYKSLLLAIVLTSIFFLFDGVTPYSLLIGLGVILVLEGKRGQLAEKITVVCLGLLSAFLVDAFWFTPKNLKIIALAPSISGIGLVTFLKFIFQIMLGLGPAILAVWWFKFAKNRPLSFAILWLLPFISLTLLFYFSNRNFLTEYIRFLPELEMGVALLFGLLVQKVNFKYSSILNTKYIIQFVILIMLLTTLLFSFYKLPARMRIFKPHPDITNTVEYQIAQWLETETGNWKLETGNSPRVFLSGSTAFWLNEFAPDVWQVRGGIDQASANRFWDRATYQIRNSSDVAEVLNWLKALRVNYAVVHDNNSSEYYHDFKFPEKFEDIGKKIYDNDKGDRIYQLDASTGLVVSSNGLKQLSKIDKSSKKEILSGYVSWLSSGQEAEVKSLGKNTFLIKADVTNDQLIALGITYDSGWQAKDARGQSIPISKDPFGNLIIEPKNQGEQEIYLLWREGLDLWLGILISTLGLFIIFKLLPQNLNLILRFVNKGWSEDE